MSNLFNMDNAYTEYKKAKNHIKKCYIALDEKDAIIPERKNLENLEPCIRTIKSKYGALIESVIIESMPTKTSYIEGEVVDLTGLKISAVYSNGASRDVTDEVICTPKNGDIIKLTDTSFLVEFEEGNVVLNEKINITVAKYVPILQYIEVTDPPKKTIYLVGNTLDLSGIVVTATYGRGEKVDVTKLCSFTPAEKTNLSLEDNKISISYTENGIVKTTQIAITVEESIRVVTGITINSQPTKLNYYTGEYFDARGLKVTATFQDGTTEDVTNYCSFEPAYIESADTTMVVVSYSENSITKSQNIPITVTESVIENIEVVEMPETNYFVGQTFDTDGMKVVANYNSGKQVDITGDCAISKTDQLTIEDETITISYLNFTTEINITVSKVEMTSISITKVPNKIIYYEGESVDLTGIEVTANFNNDSTMIINNGYTYAPEILTTNNSSVSITYQGLITTFNVTVLEPVINKIEITTPPTKTAYFKGDLIDITGMKVTGTYTDGTIEDITSKCTFTPSGALTVDDTNITATYNGLTATTPITVTTFAPTSIVITQNPDKVTYLQGDSIDLMGLIATVYFNDGTTTKLMNGDGVSATPSNDLQTTNSSVTISYTLNGITVSTSFTITVIVADPVLANNSWETISLVSESGKASEVWNVGDIKSTTIDGTSYDFRIIGFDHDTISGSTKKAGVTFEMTTLTANSYRIDESRTKGNVPCFNASEMATATLVSLFNLVETELKNNIKTVVKTSYNNSVNELQSKDFNLFILSCAEYNGEENAMYKGEGMPYSYYSAGNKAGRSSKIWTRSLATNGSDVYFHTVSTTSKMGTGIKDLATNKNYISVAFCI